jgi:hypothetical protein
MTRAGLELFYSLPLRNLPASQPNRAQNLRKSRTTKPFHENAKGLHQGNGSPGRTLLELPLRTSRTLKPLEFENSLDSSPSRLPHWWTILSPIGRFENDESLRNRATRRPTV